MKFPIVRDRLGVHPLPFYFKNAVEKFSPYVALKRKEADTWREVTYEELGLHTKRLARYLKEQGVEAGDKVALVSPNTFEWVYAFFAIQWVGGVAIPVDTRLKGTEIRHIIKHSETRYLIIASNKYEEIQEHLEDIDLKIIELDNITQKIALLEPVETPYYRDLEDTACLFYTSGTTGSSKGVMLTHKNIASNLDAFYKCFDYGPGDVFYLLIPLSHSFGITVSLLAPISSGSTIAFATSFKSKRIIEELRESRANIMLIVPIFLEKILLAIHRNVKKSALPKKLIFNSMRGLGKIGGRKVREKVFKGIRDKIGFGRMKYLISGGAKLPLWVAHGLEELGFPIMQGYGLTETSPVVSVNPKGLEKNASVGIPLPGIEVKIMDPGEDGVGEIAVKGPNVMKGYYKNEEATKEVITEDGWFLTGDMGYIDEDGYIYITGRKKSVIVTKGGKNIYPEEVEAVLLRSPFIEELLVLGGRNPTTGNEEVQAIIYPNFTVLDDYFTERGISNPKTSDIYRVIGEEIERYSRNIADYKRVKRFFIRDEEFPKTTSGKIKRYLFVEGTR